MLPAHRGPNPYMSVLSKGEEKTGITFHLMDAHFDTGAIMHQKEVPVLFTDDGYTLKLRCVKTAREELKTLLDKMEQGSIVPIPQDETLASYYKRITPKDIYIDFSMSPQDIYNKIRGFRPWAFCYLKVRNQFLQINHAQIINLSQTSFMVKNKKYRMPDLYYSEKAGRVLAKGKDWLLCSTIDSEHAILLYDVKLYGFCKGILTKHFIKQLRFIK